MYKNMYLPWRAVVTARDLPITSASCALCFMASASACSLSTRCSILCVSCSLTESASRRWSACISDCNFNCRRISSSNFFCSISSWNTKTDTRKPEVWTALKRVTWSYITEVNNFFYQKCYVLSLYFLPSLIMLIIFQHESFRFY